MPFRPLLPARSATAAALLVLAAPPAHADATSACDADTLDTVAVAAARHASDLQDVAVSLPVQDKRELDRRSFYACGDEFRGVPGVFFRRGQGGHKDIQTISSPGLVVGNLFDREYDYFYGNATDATLAVPRRAAAAVGGPALRLLRRHRHAAARNARPGQTLRRHRRA
jgi:hypothetical protein